MRKTINTLWNNSFIRGGMLFTVSSFVINIVNYFFNLLAARSLGPQGYGEITTLFSYVSITAVPSIVLSMFVIQKISSSGKQKYIFASSLVQLFWQKIKKWWFMFIFILILAPFIPKLANLSSISGLLLLPLIVFSFIATFYAAVMQGLQLFFLLSLITLFGVTLKLFGAILTTFGVDGVGTILFFILLSALIPIMVNVRVLKSYFQRKISISLPQTEKRIISLLYNPQFILILVSTLAITMLNNIDIIFVKKFLSSENAGIYSSWSLLAKIIFYALGPLIAISFIFFSSSETKKHQDTTLVVSLCILLFIGIGSFIFYKVFATFIVSLFFGARFQAVVPYLNQASIFGALYSAIQYINSYFLAIKSRFALLLFVLLPVYVILLFLIPRNLNQIIRLNILFSGFAVLSYLGAYAIIRLKKKSLIRSL